MKKIQIHGANENNLKNIDVEIPHNQLTIVTGLSGSGKSSLIRDVLQREGQRMYLETFSAYSRLKLGKIRPAKVKNVQGLLPVISVGQTHVQANRRSTAGTFSDISPLFRQLFSRFNDQQVKIPRNAFSFNSEKGWCPHCKGLGIEEYIDTSKLVASPSKSLRNGALVITLPNGYTIYSQVTIDELQKVCSHHGFSVDIPWKELTAEQKQIILHGSTQVKVLYGKHSLESRMKWSGMTARPREEGYYKGIVPVMDDILRRDRNDNILRFVSSKTCTICEGDRIGQTARKLTWKKLSYPELEKLSFSQILTQLKTITLDSEAEKQLTQSIIHRVEQFCNLSIGHISPNRLSETLSQGELRRMRLAQLNHSGLTGVLYLFDEPSIGLHIRDVQSLIDTFYKLIDRGNTVVVVEHNEQIIKSAQHLVELGPGAGKFGGEVIFNGTITNFKQDIPPKTLLKDIFFPKKTDQLKPRSADHRNEFFKVEIDSANNIKKQTFEFTKSQLNVVTGVSGAGKSTLVNYGLIQSKAFEQIIYINQKPIGRTSRSNPATYTGLFDELRKLYATTTEAKAKKYKAGHFSFNSKQGQCKACLGTGQIKTGMHIFEDLIQECPKCNGTKYKSEILEIYFNGKSIAEVLEMSVNEAMDFFKSQPRIFQYLEVMQQLGLGYLHLGQSSTTLSGGEAQRIKLASEMHKKTKQETLYILDEPTTGLHGANINMLLNALHKLINSGHTVVLVEHDAQVIKNADWIVDIGPEGGENGGKMLFCGPKSEFIKTHESPTSIALKTPQTTIQREGQVKNFSIQLKGITTNNLKKVDINIPAGKIVVFTGVSGSGKTSLLIDTLSSEGQRLFMENMSTYRRMQLKINRSAKVRHTESIMPTVTVTADQQKPNIRSTAASLSGVYDLMRLLYARFAKNPDSKSITAADFSLNNEYSVCQSCEGTGFEKRCLPERIIIDPAQAILSGALITHKSTNYFISPKNKYRWILLAMANAQSIDLEKGWNKLKEKNREKILWGTGEQTYEAIWSFERKNNKGNHEFTDSWKGLCNLIEEEYKTHYPSARGKNALELLTDIPCKTCKGNKLNSEMLQYTFEGLHMGQALQLNISDWHEILSNTTISISQALKQQLLSKLSFLIKADLGKIPLGRPAKWLSTGELKWIKLSSILSSTLSGMCIILDEPSAGMDKASKSHLVNALSETRKRGNTILISDHNKEIILAADNIIEIGPGSGQNGGEIVATTTPSEINNSKAIVAKTIIEEKPQNTRQIMELDTEKITIAQYSFYKNRINLIYGKTGSGKTTLLKTIDEKLKGNEKVIFIKSSSLTGNKYSNIATRTAVLDDLKKQFSNLNETKNESLKAADFGFSNKKSQCSKCKGTGYTIVSMDFMPDIKEICSDCNGKRYKEHILRFKLYGKSIAEWLDLNIDELSEFDFWTTKTQFEINTLQQVGLGYLSVGREVHSLSEGEKRRLQLAEELIPLRNNQSVVLFDNPGHGLDPFNLQNLFDLFDRLIEKGHTIIMADEERFKNKTDHFEQL